MVKGDAIYKRPERGDDQQVSNRERDALRAATNHCGGRDRFSQQTSGGVLSVRVSFHQKFFNLPKLTSLRIIYGVERQWDGHQSRYSVKSRDKM